MINLTILKISKLSAKHVLSTLALLVFIVSSGYLGYYYYKTQKELSAYKESSEAVAIKEMNDLLKKVGRLVLIPQNELPTVATIANADDLRQQAFFSMAENGDKVIIYKNAQRVILYRPSLDKIIETSRLTVKEIENTITRSDTPNNDQAVAGDKTVLVDGSSETVITKTVDKVEPAAPAKLAIYNGTLYVEGLATKVGAFLVKEIPGNVISVEILKNAEEVYDKTIVIDVTQKYEGLAKQISEKLSAQLEEKPSDVEFPNVDIVIVAGTDILDQNLQ